MAEMFLKLDGIEGESLDFAHAGEIEIKNWEWHTVNNVKWDVNQGGQSTKVEVKDIDLKKICDKASVTLYQCCVTGKHIKNGKITCRKNDGDQKVERIRHCRVFSPTAFTKGRLNAHSYCRGWIGSARFCSRERSGARS